MTLNLIGSGGPVYVHGVTINDAPVHSHVTAEGI